MAGPVDEQARPEPQARNDVPAARPVRPRTPVRDFTRHFRLAYFGLAVLFWVTVAGGTLLFTHHSKPKASWSAWAPSLPGLEGAQQIANHVAPEYRLDTQEQLVSVTAEEPEVQKIPLSAVAIRIGGRFFGFPAKNAIVYVFCGGGQRCSIASGEATNARGRLLQREALELSLYTFRYLDDFDSVITFLPPPPGKTSNRAVFLRKAELESLLRRPLSVTLPPVSELTPSNQTGSSAVIATAGHRSFASSFQAAPDGGAVLVLDPLTAST